MNRLNNSLALLMAISLGLGTAMPGMAQVGVGTDAPEGAILLFDGTREMLDDKWTYWEGPRFAAELPIKWQIVDDPVDDGMAVSSKDPTAAGGLYGAADIVTKQKFRPRWNKLAGESTAHGCTARTRPRQCALAPKWAK